MSFLFEFFVLRDKITKKIESNILSYVISLDIKIIFIPLP